MRITTWNANSIRLRADGIARIVKELDPDIICLQEIKVETSKFPHALIDPHGYPYRHIHGQKGYHGVAILAKKPFRTVHHRFADEREEHRHAFVEIGDGIELHNLYIPAGGDVPDPDANVKFAQKLRMIDGLANWFAGEPSNRRVLVGDFNIAPLPSDVWSHKQLLKVVSHTPIEVEKLQHWQESGAFVDAVRHVIPADKKLYSWWSYRSRDWSASDRGRRLDHVWVGPELAPCIRHASIWREARGWPEPSDHVPVTVDLDL